MQITDFYSGIVLTINLLRVHILFHVLVATPAKLSTARAENGTTLSPILGSCPDLLAPVLGKTACLIKPHVRECTASCFPGFYFEHFKNVNSMTLKCYEDSWAPLQEFPPCRPGPRCTLKAQGNGYFDCTSDADGAHCDVTCDGTFRGQYHCSLRQWSPSLPHCVVPADEKAVSLCQDPGIREGVIRRTADDSAAEHSRSFEEGESLKFLCKKKINTLHGHKFIICKPDGKWSGGLPHCTNTSSSDGSASVAAVLYPTTELFDVAIWIAIFLSSKNTVFRVL